MGWGPRESLQDSGLVGSIPTFSTNWSMSALQKCAITKYSIQQGYIYVDMQTL